jgi:hypothetical protein
MTTFRMARRSETPAFETKSEWAYRRLRRMIADGELAAGSRLVLRQLASDFGLLPANGAARRGRTDDWEAPRVPRPGDEPEIDLSECRLERALAPLPELGVPTRW